jgi:hypothetical protein
VKAPSRRARQRSDRVRKLGRTKSISGSRPSPHVRFEEGGWPRRDAAVVQTSDLWNYSPDLSADGTQLAFVSTRSGRAAGVGGESRWIRRVGRCRRFTRAALRQPRWSADGTRILNQRERRRPTGSVRDSRLRTGAPRDSPTTRAMRIAPSWSRDGASGVVRRGRSGTWQVMRPHHRRSLSRPGDSRRWLRRQRVSDGGSISSRRLDTAGSVDDAIDADRRRSWCRGIRACGDRELACDAAVDLLHRATADQPVIRRAPLSGGQSAISSASIANYSCPASPSRPMAPSIVSRPVGPAREQRD